MTPQPEFNGRILEDRLHQASSSAVLSSTPDFSKSAFIPRQVGSAEITDITADFLLQTGIINKEELVATRGILRAKQQVFAERDKESQDEEEPTRYPMFVGGSLLANLQVMREIVYDFYDSNSYEGNVARIERFMGRIIADREALAEAQPLPESA